MFALDGAPKEIKLSLLSMDQVAHHDTTLTKEEAFLQMVERQKDLIWRICSDYSFSPAWQTEDAFQDALCVLWRDFDSFNHFSSEQTWVYRVTTNCMLMIKRSMRNRPQPSSSAHPETPSVISDNFVSLLQLIDQLSDTDAKIVRANLDGYSHAEIAAMFDLSVPAVAMRLSRAKKWLRKHYKFD